MAKHGNNDHKPMNTKDMDNVMKKHQAEMDKMMKDANKMHKTPVSKK